MYSVDSSKEGKQTEEIRIVQVLTSSNGEHHIGETVLGGAIAFSNISSNKNHTFFIYTWINIGKRMKKEEDYPIVAFFLQ